MRQAAAHTPVCGLESHMEGGAFFAGIRMATGRPPGRPIRQGAPARKAPRAPVMRLRRQQPRSGTAGPCRGHARPMQAGRACRGGFRPPRSRLFLGGHAGLRRRSRSPAASAAAFLQGVCCAAARTPATAARRGGRPAWNGALSTAAAPQAPGTGHEARTRKISPPAPCMRKNFCPAPTAAAPFLH